MKKGKAVKIILFIATLCLVAAMLASCSGLTGGSTGTTKNGGNSTQGGESTADKIALSDAAKNYDEQTAKRADIAAEVAFEVYTEDASSETGFKASKVGVNVDLTRTENDGKYYDVATMAPGDVSDEMVGILTTVKDFCEGNGGFIMKAFALTINEETKEELKLIAPYLEYVQAFLQGKITCKAEIGYLEESVNLKAQYKYNRSNKDVERGDIWCASDMESFSKAVPGTITDEMIRSALADPLLKIAATSQGRDEASAKEALDGTAKYRIIPQITTEKESILKVLKDAFGALNVDMNETVTEKLFANIGKWVSIEEGSAINVTVGKDKLPDNMNYKVKAILEIPVDEFKRTVIDMKNYGLSDDMASTINTLIGALDLLVGFERKDRTKVLRFGLGLNVTENYLYSDKDCSLEEKDADLYKDASVDEENRLELNTVFTVLTEDKVEEFVTNVVALVDEEGAEEIGTQIRAQVAEEESVTLYDLGKITMGVLRDYAKQQDSLKDTVDSIIKKILNGELTIRVNASANGEDNVNE